MKGPNDIPPKKDWIDTTVESTMGETKDLVGLYRFFWLKTRVGWVKVSTRFLSSSIEGWEALEDWFQ